jgi:hypothetical protein
MLALYNPRTDVACPVHLAYEGRGIGSASLGKIAAVTNRSSVYGVGRAPTDGADAILSTE